MKSEQGKSTIKELMNTWGTAGIPFLFVIDFEQNKPLIFKLDEINPQQLLYWVNGVTNGNESPSDCEISLEKYPETYNTYLKKFTRVTDEISAGNSYLVNLTCATPVQINISLRDIFYRSKARYKLFLDEQFVCFSPEIFIQINEGRIMSFPMKGTIDASIPGAAGIIIKNQKETAEHYTIVDLIRNDLNMVSKNVRVERFRYIETIKAGDKELLQVSSEICGDLDSGYSGRIGDIVSTLLPAGSVSGAPKKKTVEIISSVENLDRGYYTGIFGIFDGKKLDCGVLIRFIEKTTSGLLFRSGGGITSFSDPVSEYNEMIDKIYVPFA